MLVVAASIFVYNYREERTKMALTSLHHRGV